MQLSTTRGGEFGATENVFELSLTQAVAGTLGGSSQDTHSPLSASKLNKVTQLTGFSDPVYSEAYVHVNQYDIVLDVLIVNQTCKWYFRLLPNKQFLSFLLLNYLLLGVKSSSNDRNQNIFFSLFFLSPSSKWNLVKLEQFTG